MLPEHVDVDIPVVLRGRVGELLADFENYLCDLGFTGPCQPMRKAKKDGGKHVTDWWLYVPLDAKAPTKSIVKYGETVYNKINPVPQRAGGSRPLYEKTAS